MLHRPVYFPVALITLIYIYLSNTIEKVALQDIWTCNFLNLFRRHAYDIVYLGQSSKGSPGNKN